MNDFYKNKNILITGASSGIGESLVSVLNDLYPNANLIIAARNIEKLQKIKDHCTNSNITIIKLDLMDKASIYDAVNSIQIIPDIIIHNAGISSRASIYENSIESVETIMKTNFFGPVLLTTLLLPKMKKLNNGGIIALISSVQGKIALPNRASYSASKHAIQAWCDSLRSEVFQDNIHVLTISPGYVSTNLSINALNGDGSKYNQLDKNTKNGMSPVILANIILKSIANKNSDIDVCDFKTYSAIIYSRLMPNLFRWIMNKRAASDRNNNKED